MSEKMTFDELVEQFKELSKIVEELKQSKCSCKKSFSKISVNNNEFELAGYKWKILDKIDDSYLCICESIGDKVFDNNTNNWAESELRKYLNEEFYKKISDVIGKENLVPFERNLLSIDGLNDYGVCVDLVSLITTDEYRKYRKELGEYDDWWWTCTANGEYMAGVSPSGYFGRTDSYDDYGVRPICIFLSSIFESFEDEE